MKIKVKIPRRDLTREDKFQERVKEEYIKWKNNLLNRAKNIKDLKELRKIFDELDKNQFDWDSAAGGWLESSEPYEIVCIAIRLPGLKENYERYSIYGILSFSKGLTDSFDHTGDLERLVYVKDEKGNYFSYSTVGHGYLELFPEILGNNSSFKDLIQKEEYVFEVGDHSLCTERDDTKILIGKIPFIDIFRIIKTNIYKDHIYKEIPLLTSTDLEEKLEVNWYDFAKEVVQIDQAIKKELNEYSKLFRIKRAFHKFKNYLKKKKELDQIYFLNAVRSTIWHIAPLKQVKILNTLKEEMIKHDLEHEIDSEIPRKLDTMLYRLENLIDSVDFLKWIADHDPKKLLRKFEINVIKDLKPSAIETLPFALGMILNKPLDDIGYPEKLSPIEKGKRIIFWIGGNIYRILRSQFANINKGVSDRFKSITNIIDRLAFKEENE
ncbi:MAG: hypothetical protein ACTSWR_04165 [Candidatus Helarchaeota archaeon]